MPLKRRTLKSFASRSQESALNIINITPARNGTTPTTMTLCVDISRIGFENSVELIKSYLDIIGFKNKKNSADRAVSRLRSF